MNKLFATIVSLSCAASLSGFAQNPIVITKNPNYVVPVSISGLDGEADSVLKFDLYVLGMEITTPDKAEYQINGAGDGRVEGRLTHAGDSTPLFNKSYSGGSIRSQAHSLADDVVTAIRGAAPIFHTRIAFRIQQGSSTEIGVSDFDGHDAMAVTHDGALVATPCWVPGRRILLYTTWKNGDAQILKHDLATGARTIFARYPGSCFSPEVSPDGQRVAMILSKGGSPNVYVCNIDGGDLRQLTRTRDEASCPCWSPDGQEICYADRHGRASLRKVSSNGGEPTALRVFGPDIYGNITAPDWSPDGKQIVFTCGSGNFRICVVSAAGGQAQQLVAGEDPCWAPNSRTVIFTRRENGRQVLCLLDVPTKHVKDVRQVSGSCSQPAWAR
jgi:TolB protein